jgi:hypothetical protein
MTDCTTPIRALQGQVEAVMSTRTLQEQYAEYGQVAAAMTTVLPGDRRSVEEVTWALRTLEERRGREVVQRAAPAISCAIGGAVEAGVAPGGLSGLAARLGYVTAGAFVGAEVEQAMVRQGVEVARREPVYPASPELVAATGRFPAWSRRPVYYDYRKGAEIAEQLGSPQGAVAYAQLHYGIRAAGDRETAEGLLRTAGESHQGERAFLDRVECLMAGRDLDDGDFRRLRLYTWLRYAESRRHETAAEVCRER